MTIAVTGFLIAVYILMEYGIVAKDTMSGAYYGSNEAKLIQLYQEGDEMKFNLEYFGNEAFKRSLLRLGEKAGWSKSNEIPSNCFIDNLAVLALDVCRPDLKRQLKIEFMRSFNELVNDFKYAEFTDDEIGVSDSFIAGEKKKDVKFSIKQDKNVEWNIIKPRFKIEIKDFRLITDVWDKIDSCNLKSNINLIDCLKGYGFKIVTRDFGKYLFVTIDTGKKFFYKGEIKTLEVNFAVEK